ARMRASDILLIDGDDPSCLKSFNPPERTAWAIHGALHRNLAHACCVLHLHCKYATVLACFDQPFLPPIDQNAMRFFDRVAVDKNFGGMGLNDEAERLSHCLQDKNILVMGNHGVLVVGQTVAQAFDEIYYFEKACENYITALMCRKKLSIVSDEIAQKTARQWLEIPESAEQHLQEIIRILEEEESDFCH
ncbi:MAG: class II aldolase/adducin family protein, partial [Pseudomonadota bacterium]